MSIAETQLAPARPRVRPLAKRQIRNLDHPRVINKTTRYEKLKQEATRKKLSLSPVELAYLKTIADEFANSQKLFKGSWEKEVHEYLINLNTNFNAREALKAAFKFVNGKKAHSALEAKIKKFTTNIEDKFTRARSDKKAIEFMARLGSEAAIKASNPEFPDQHVLLLGEHHKGLPQEDGSFLNPPTVWLENNLDKLRKAGYDTLALEVPYDIDPEEWLEKGNSLWHHSSQEHIETVKKLRDEALEYFAKKNTHGPDKGMVLFVEKVNNWLLKKVEEKKIDGSITLRDPSKPKIENTGARWLKLARKAERAGFRILTTDASRKITHENERIVYFFKDIIDGIKDKTEGLELIEEYLIYKRGLTMTVRDLAMGSALEQALRVSHNNVIGLYGANHTKTTLANSRTSAKRVLNRKNIPVVSVAMEFPGMQDKEEHTLLDQRLNIQPHERPSIIRLADMPFAQSQRLTTYRDFQTDNHRFSIDSKENPTIGEQAPHDAAILFSVPKKLKPEQNS